LRAFAVLDQLLGPDPNMMAWPLAAACDLIEDPWSNWAMTEKDETPFDHIIMEDLSDADILKAVQETQTARGGDSK